MSFIDLKDSIKKENSKEQIINQTSLLGNYIIIAISLLVSIFFSYSYFIYDKDSKNIEIIGTLKDTISLYKDTHGKQQLKFLLREYPFHIFAASRPEIQNINLSDLISDCKVADTLKLLVNKSTFDDIQSKNKEDYIGFYELKSNKNTYLYAKDSAESQKSEYKFGAIMFGLLCVFFIYKTIKIKKPQN
jgi:hypothetical protein